MNAKKYISKSVTSLALGGALIVAAGGALFGGLSAKAAGGGEHAIEHQHWSWGGMFGRFDKAQLQRGYQVYKEVCASCHGLKRVAFRNLSEPGGPEFPVDRVKALAATFKVQDGPNDQGKMFMRPALPSDRFVSPFANDNEARSVNNGALPPDLSLITRARDVHVDQPFYLVPLTFLKNVVRGYQEGGADYTYALLVGYRDKAPAGVKLADGMYYNTAFPGNQIAMPPPLSKDNFTKYQDGSGSLEQSAKDVTAFLAWAANPKLEARKSLGVRVMIYLLLLTVLLFLAKKRIWSRLGDH